MIKKLTKQDKEIYFYLINGEKKIIDRKDKSTYPKCISGTISECLFGNVSGLFGNVSNISGDCTNVKGNLDECELTEDERKKGVYIKDLVK